MKLEPINARPLALAHLTALELAPLPLVRLAASTGFAAVGLRMHPASAGTVAYPLHAGGDALRELRHTLSGEGISVHDVEFVPVVPGLDPASLMPLFEAAAMLGARCINVSGDDPDSRRLAAMLSSLAELAQPFGLRIDLEFMRWRHIGSLTQACALLERAAHPNLAVLIDALHLSRSGGTPSDVAAMPRGWIGSFQLCDAPHACPANDEALIQEARAARLPPGAGALPLGDLLCAAPADVALSVEMPFPSLPSGARVELAYRSARRVVDHVRASRAEVPQSATAANRGR